MIQKLTTHYSGRKHNSLVLTVSCRIITTIFTIFLEEIRDKASFNQVFLLFSFHTLLREPVATVHCCSFMHSSSETILHICFVLGRARKLPVKQFSIGKCCCVQIKAFLQAFCDQSCSFHNRAAIDLSSELSQKQVATGKCG